MLAAMIHIIRSGELAADFYAPRLSSGAEEAVRAILADVRARGDAAVREYGARFDKCAPETLEIPLSDAAEAARTLRREQSALYDALCYSRDLALRFARMQREAFACFEIELEPGLFAGQRIIPVERAGAYVPAGRYPLLSTVIMTVCPALAAGVADVVLCTPPRKRPGDASPAQPWADSGILAAASLCGVTRIFAAGGAQAIAAMGYGTESVPQCSVLVGPGNKYVAEAKRQIFGHAGIDMVAGPTEVLVIADGNADPAWLAADLIAQAEHDADAQAVLVTDSEALARAVDAELGAQLERHPAPETARASLARNGCAVLVPRLRDALALANRKAAEHVELALEAGAERDFFAQRLTNYGSLFVGCRAAEVLGDYAAGINHTLPTSGSARFAGGLSVRCFLKTVTTLRAERGVGTDKSFAAAAEIARAEGLFGHAAAADIRGL
jgi:histidinol dehydrogenase